MEGKVTRDCAKVVFIIAVFDGKAQVDLESSFKKLTETEIGIDIVNELDSPC